MTHYQKGARLERELKHWFERQGCVVMRSAGSKGSADLCVVYPDGHIRFIQVKKSISERAAANLITTMKARLNNPAAGISVFWRKNKAWAWTGT